MTFAPPITRRNHGRGHSYRDANGAKVPGVTTIIKNGLPKTALIHWAAERTAAHAIDHWDELAELPPSERMKRLMKARNTERDAAANRGTKVHKLAEKIGAGEKVAVPDELAGHVEAYIQFLDDFDVRPVLSEFVVVSHVHGYAGTGDLIADLVATEAMRERWPAITVHDERARLLLDIKTSRSGVYGETGLQLAGYRYADTYFDDEAGIERPVPAVHGCGVVWVRADGYDLVPVEAGRTEFRSLLYVAQVAEFDTNSRDLVGDALTPPRLEATA